MASQTDLQSRLDAIEAAIAAGVTRVSYDNKSVEYSSLSQLRSIRDELLGQMGRSNAIRRRTVARFSGGF